MAKTSGLNPPVGSDPPRYPLTPPSQRATSMPKPGQPEPPAQYIDTRRGAGPCSGLLGPRRGQPDMRRTASGAAVGRSGVGHRGAGQRSDREPGAMLGPSGAAVGGRTRTLGQHRAPRVGRRRLGRRAPPVD